MFPCLVWFCHTDRVVSSAAFLVRLSCTTRQSGPHGQGCVVARPRDPECPAHPEGLVLSLLFSLPGSTTLRPARTSWP